MKQSECVRWEGDHYKTGYGRKYIPGPRCSTRGGYGRKGHQVYAHRAVMAEIYGWEAIEGKVVMHTCDVRDCVNPDHLRIGTIAENNRDMFAKGRHPGGRGQRPGEANAQAKLSAQDVRDIRAAVDETYAALAARYGVDPSNISRIVNRQTWKAV